MSDESPKPFAEVVSREGGGFALHVAGRRPLGFVSMERGVDLQASADHINAAVAARGYGDGYSSSRSLAPKRGKGTRK